MKGFIKQKLHENLDYTILESLIDEDYPSNFNMDEFKKLRQFSKRVQYCKDNLRFIAAGTGRMTFMVDDTKVLKLAKNEKGIAQNEVEIQWGGDYYFDSILAHTFDSDDNGLWVEMELAKKVTPTIFKQYVGVDIKTVYHYLANRFAENRRSMYSYPIDPEVNEQLHNNDFVTTLYELGNAQGVEAGDFGRLSTYGLVNREGENRVVVIDFGITNDVIQSYYR